MLSAYAPPLPVTEHPHGWIRDIDPATVLTAEYLFNPSLGMLGGSLWMVYRRITPDEWLAGPRLLGLCRLGADLHPDPDSNIELSELIEDPPDAQRWHADPRLFDRAGTLWMSYHDNYRLCLTPLDPRHPAPLRPRTVTLLDRRPRDRERNWGFFQIGDSLRAVYSIHPFTVLDIDETVQGFGARTRYQTHPRLPWDQERWGEPHGGSMPVQVGDYRFAFFQAASYDEATNHRRYRIGLYGFDADPPHRLRLMSRAPILDAGDFAGPQSFYNDWSVVYPSGALHFGGKWLLSLGIHDRRMALAVLDHDTLLQDCVEV